MVFLKFIYSEKVTKFWTAKSTDFALAGSKMAGSGSGEPERLVRNLPDLVLRGTCQKLRYTLMEWGRLERNQPEFAKSGRVQFFM